MYFAHWLLKTTLTAVLAILGLAPLAMLLYPWPVANYWWRGQRANALGLVLSAVVGMLIGAEWALAFYAAALAGLGIVAGQALQRQWTFGRCVSVLTGLAFGLALFNNAMNWELVKSEMAKHFRQNTLLLENLQAEQGESLQAQIDFSRWLLEHIEYFAFGSLFATMFLLCTGAVALLNWYARKHGASLRGNFSGMRPPDYLVWLAIASATAIMADAQWPNEVLRLVAWNTGTGLAVVYWLNGVACTVYLVTTLQLNVFLTFALAILAFMPAAVPVFTLLGFFDTWLEARVKVDRLLEFRDKLANSQGDE